MAVIYLAGNGWQYRIFIVNHNTVLHSIVRNKPYIVKPAIATRLKERLNQSE